MPDTNALLEIIQSLPPARITAREQERTLTHAATAASEPSFAIWNNPDDAAYDAP